MAEAVSDDRIRHLVSSSVQLQGGTVQASHSKVMEEVLRQLPPEVDQARVKAIVAEFMPNP